jgi:hypothetical protein
MRVFESSALRLAPSRAVRREPERSPKSTLAFPAISFEMKPRLNAVQHVSGELSDQLDVTLENSKIVKLALTWVVTTQSEAIK